MEETFAAISKRAGMGANPYPGGVSFRVWAPHADQVFVTGSFNNWSADADPLAREGEEFWSADIDRAKPGDEYRFLVHNGDQVLSRIDPYAREVTNSIGNGIIRKPGFDWGDEDFRMPNWNELVIYEMHIGSFFVTEAGKVGTFTNAIEKLPYLKEMGFNAVEVMPVSEFPGDFSWGYNPAQPFTVESSYGGPDGLAAFVNAAHQNGIGVILDVVYNHFGPSDLDLWRFDGWSANDKGGIYFYNDERAATPWGDTRPDYGRGEVRQYLRDNALMWLEEYHVDGLRWDATAFIRMVDGNQGDIPDGWTLMQWIHAEIASRQPWKITIAEDLRDNPAITERVENGGAGFGAQWDGSFNYAVRHAIISPDDASRQMGPIANSMLHSFNGDVFRRVVYTESHDEVANGKARVPEEIWPGRVGNWFSKKRSTLGAALVYTAPGIPMIFQGQELLEDRWFQEKDPLDWSRAHQFSGLLHLYRDLVRLRRNLDGVSAGLCGQNVQVHHVNEQEKLLAFHRWAEGGPKDSVIVIANLANQTCNGYQVGLPRAGAWKQRFNSDWVEYDTSFSNQESRDMVAEAQPRDGMPFTGTLDIGPYTVVIYSQDD